MRLRENEESNLKNYDINFRSKSKPAVFAVDSGHSEIQRMVQEVTIFIRILQKKKKKLKIETFKKELKALFLEKNEFEN